MHKQLKYNPNIHHRRSIRLKGYDYAQKGFYFITICCQDRICRFGNIVNGQMILNEYGQIAFDEWVKLSVRFANFELDVFQIMPNHMHGIIKLNDATAGVTSGQHGENVSVRAGFTPAQHDENATAGLTSAQYDENATAGFTPVQHDENATAGSGVTPDQHKRQPQGIASTTVSDIVGAYKSLVVHGCLDIYKSKNETMGKLWQRNYYEIIIRNELSHKRISAYIINNPKKWAEDKFNKIVSLRKNFLR